MIEGVEKLEPLYTDGGDLKKGGHFGKQSGSSSKVKHRVTV